MGTMVKDIIDYDRDGFIIHGEHEFLIGGEFHYFRVPAELWEDRLQKMKALGANLISVYIAWNMHEPEEGRQIWSGDYDLGRFLTLCEKYGFYVLIKPGPYICAELDFGGHPDWLIKKVADGEFRIRMLDEGYLNLCKYWYKSCAEQILPHLITNGGTIIAAQVENEYDHLMEYGEEQISEEDAVKYFMFLKDAMEEYGVNVPKFANEAEFLRGKGIIDTRTYYPNIPGLWMSEYERFEQKLLSSKETQPDSPVMILELQAGWFSQIGEPTYVPGVDVVEGVSKSVFITGASIINYYMMVGGTTFPFTGGRGDVALGGYGNITSYDFGGAPVGETGELNKEKFHWIKGFIRFAKEFYKYVSGSDGKKYMEIISGGEDIAVLGQDGAFLDTSLDRSYENFTTYEEGNQDGRFFFVRNAEDRGRQVTVAVPEALNGRAYSFRATIPAGRTRMFPVSFWIPGTDVRVNYATSELWMTKRRQGQTAAVMYGMHGADGELCLNAAPECVVVEAGDVKVYDGGDGNSILIYRHGEAAAVRVRDAIFFLLEEGMVGKVEELEEGLLFHNAYYLEQIEQKPDGVSLRMQVKEGADMRISYYPMDGRKARHAFWDGKEISWREKGPVQQADVRAASFVDRPQAHWASGWKYCPDSAEIEDSFDDSGWTYLEKPVSLEQKGFFRHGYYWFRSAFEMEDEAQEAYLSFQHNDTDRYLVYLNGELVFRARDKSIHYHKITGAVRKGKNTIAVLYANEFHNKSHPHEGALVKYSGILHPFTIEGAYKNGGFIHINVESFRVREQLSGWAAGYHTGEYDDSQWQCAPDAEKMVIGKEMGHVVWFRRHFTYHPAAGYHAPLQLVVGKADERLLIYVNGRPVGQYDTIGPQEEFYLPDSYLSEGDNVVSLVLECPGFFEEIMGGYRRGYLCQPVIQPAYVSKEADMGIVWE